MPSISVIVPVYNTATWLPRCLESLCAQSCGDMEIICIDDGSTDGSTAIIHEYAARDKRLLSIRLGSNRGAAAARNVGMAAASGDYLGFLDSDDTLDTAFYGALLATARQTGADIIKGDLKIRTLEGHWEHPDMNRLVRTSPAFFSCNFGTAIYRRTFLQENGIYFPPLSNGEDLAFLMKAVSRCEHIPVLDGHYYHYWHRQGSASKSRPSQDMLRSMMRYMDDVLDYLNRKIIFPDRYIIQCKKLIDDCHMLMGIFSEKKLRTLCAEKIISIYGACEYKEHLEKSLCLDDAFIIYPMRQGNSRALVDWPNLSLIQKLRFRVPYSHNR